MICKSLPMSAFSHYSVNLRKVSLVLQLHSPVHTIQDAISTIYFSKLDFTEQLHRQRIHNINRLPPGITHDQEKFLRCNMHGWLNAHLSKYQPASLASTTTTTMNHFKLRVFVDDPEWLNKSHENSPKSEFIRTITTFVVFSLPTEEYISTHSQSVLIFVLCHIPLLSPHANQPVQNIFTATPPPLSAASSALKIYLFPRLHENNI